MNQVLKHLFLLLMFAVLTVHQADAADTARKEIPLSGKVLETMDGGGYTYLLLQNGPEKVWVAIPLTKITVGQQLSLTPGFAMKNFSSKALNRKFDQVIFSAGPSDAKKMQLSPSAIKALHQGVPGAPGGQQVQPAKEKTTAQAARPAPKSQKVTKAKGANAYTIAEVFAKSKKLEKKQVVIRGRVVNVAERIMKKNWIHLEDGTGSKAKKTDNLVVTSKELPKVGDVVTITGTLYNNLDFGSGYRYKVLIQDATLKK